MLNRELYWLKHGGEETMEIEINTIVCKKVALLKLSSLASSTVTFR